ncbi:MAG: ABC transporter permease [Halobacteriales archaeon]
MNVDVELTARQDVPAWLVYGTPVFTVLGALLLSSVALLVLGVDPLAGYYTMFVDPWTSQFGIANVLEKSVPLILAGLAVYLPLRAGLWNIGATGQLYIGAIIGTWVGLNVSLPGLLLVPLMLVVAGVGGGVWGFIPGYLRARWDVNEIIVSLLIAYAAIRINGYVVRGPMQGGLGNFPQSAILPAAAQLPDIPVLGAHVGFLVALLAVGAAWVLVKRARIGYEITVVGANPDAARQAGMRSSAIYVLVFVVGGALAGMAGVIEIAGIQGRLRPEFSPGYGFTAIPIALLGRNGAVQVFVAALFFGLLFVGGTALEINYSVPAALVDVIQALIILFLITAEFFKQFAIDVTVEFGRAAEPAVPGIDEGV